MCNLFNPDSCILFTNISSDDLIHVGILRVINLCIINVFNYCNDNVVVLDVCVSTVSFLLLLLSYQMTAFLLLFLIGSQIEIQLISTGAFEVYLNGMFLVFL